MKTQIQTLTRNSVLVSSTIVAAISAQGSADYGPAVWNPPGCVKYYTSGAGHQFHVVHDMEGYYLTAISTLRSCSTTVSVHYAINGVQDSGTDAPAGEITQMIAEANYAWHVGPCWNTHCTGTEHEGFVSNPAWFTEAMYQASAGLTRHIADKFGYAKDRNHIVGHNEWQNAGWYAYAQANFGLGANCNSHTDPGTFWDWSHYMALINPTSSYTAGDFYGNGHTDYVLFSPTTAAWSVRDSQGAGQINSFAFGNAGDIPLIGSWSTPTGAECALFRPSTGWWYVRSGITGNLLGSFQWGQNGDIPLIGAWSGQMRDQAVFRPSTGMWYVRDGSTGGTSSFSWGLSGDIPLVGNWAGNGMVDQAMFRPSNGTWYVRNGRTGATMGSFVWGQSGDIPLIGAWSGQMRDTAMFRPSNGTWYVRDGLTGGTSSFVYGQNGDQPMVGNIFGHGMVDQIVYRPSTGMWYVRDGITGASYDFAFGDSTFKLVHE